jgi:hypothetical protein
MEDIIYAKLLYCTAYTPFNNSEILVAVVFPKEEIKQSEYKLIISIFITSL